MKCRILKIWICFLAVVVSLGTQAADSVVFWNKLGSDTEVLNSEIGANGTLIGSGYAYESAQFNNGYVRNIRDSWLEFPSTILDSLRERGTLSLWINSKVTHPVPYQYGFFAFVGMPNAPYPSERGRVWLIWGDGVTGRGFVGGVNFGDTVNGQIAAITPNEATQFEATPGVPFHAAIVWDIDGIDGSSDKVRVYRDGEIVGRTSSGWILDGSRQQQIMLGQSPDEGGYDKFITDNLIIYDYAKTDFSDRFIEDPTFNTAATFSVARAILRFNSGEAEASDSLLLEGSLVLNENSDGIDPGREETTIKVGALSITIPTMGKRFENIYVYRGTINEAKVRVKLTRVSADRYDIQLLLGKVDLSGTSNPLEISLTVGNDTGKTEQNLAGVLFSRRSEVSH